MGQTTGRPTYDRLQAAFAKDQCVVERIHEYGEGLLCVARTSAANYVDYALDAEETARRILHKEGPLKRVIYVRGSAYEMGFLMGRHFPNQVEAVCTTYINHMTPQFLSESLDMAMMSAPLFYQSVYEVLLTTLTEVLIQGSNRAFRVAIDKGDIPPRSVDELRGLVDGANSTALLSAVTMERVVAANYGLDYMVALVMSGQLLQRLKQEWSQLPPAFQNQVPFNDSFVGMPDMCNAFMASKKATANDDIFLMRDFQFTNAHVYHRFCTLVIRAPTEHGRMTHMDVTMPGLIGAVTSLNAAGVALGVNMVRSGAVDRERLGLGSMLMFREVMETCRDVDDTERCLKQHHKGVPWLFYAIDAHGTMRVFEQIAEVWEAKLTERQWVDRASIRAVMPPDADLVAWKLPQHERGIWARTGTHPTGQDDQLRRWNEPMVRALKHPELVEPARWQPGGFLYPSWMDEQETVRTVSNYYFPPWRPIGPDVTVVNNSFLNPVLRLTQMNWISTLAERISVGNQWRYDTLVSQLKQQYGTLTYETCKEIITFLSPWKQPGYPQNAPSYRHGIPSFIEYMRPHPTQSPPKLHETAVLISGSISLVDVKRRRVENRSGYWGNEFYALTLTHYLDGTHE